VRFLARTVLAATFIVACSAVTTVQAADSGAVFVPMTDQVSAEAPVSVMGDKGAAVDNGECESGCGLEGVAAAGCPRLVGQVNWVYLWRDKPDRTDILVGPNREVLVSGSDFDMGQTPGLDTTLTYYHTCDTGFEVRYLWLDDQRSEVTADAPFFAARQGSVTANHRPVGARGIPAEYSYTSKLQTIELNLRKKFSSFDLLLGFRYADFRERLEADFTYTNFVQTQAWGPEFNNLYGFQGGTEATLWQSANGKLRIDACGKAGIYYNQMTTHLGLPPLNGLGYLPTISAEASKTAFLGELGFNAAYQINSHLALRAGYQLLWLSGVATAGRQVPMVGSGNGSTGTPFELQIDGNSSVFYHGLNTGLEVTW
jgi:hypothetical protein